MGIWIEENWLLLIRLAEPAAASFERWVARPSS
jgi:hypothetical protein